MKRLILLSVLFTLAVARAESAVPLPLSFEPNRGQSKARVKFIARTAHGTVYLAERGIVFVDRNGAEARMKFDAARPAELEALDLLPGISNYYMGRDPARWTLNVRHYSRIRYRGLYSGIDLIVDGTEGRVAYDFVVQPGGDARDIAMRVEGAKLDLDSVGDLLLRTRTGEFRHRRPFIYQVVNGERHEVSGAYVLKNRRTIGFQVSGYDRRLPLVIDPTIDYSTYLGGSDFEFADHIAVDAQGNAYVTGFTYSSDFRNASNSRKGPTDCFVAKLNSAGTQLLYSTYLGGSGSDAASGIAVDSAGNAWVAGGTGSNDFPMVNPHQPSNAGGGDAFVARLNANGTLAFSSYHGGSNADVAYGVAVAPNSTVYVTGKTESPLFPLKNAMQSTLQGGTDGFIVGINGQTNLLLFSSLLGWNGADTPRGIAVDASSNFYVAGYTTSNNLQATAGAHQATAKGQAEGFVIKVNPAGSTVLYATYLGGSDVDYLESIAVDSSGDAYVTGLTFSGDFPVKSAYQSSLKMSASCPGCADAFISRLDGVAGLVYSTYLGSDGWDGGLAIAVHGRNAWVTGITMSKSFPQVLPLQTPANPADAFVAKLSTNGATLEFATDLGGSSQDTGWSIAAGLAGDIYVTGNTSSNDFPIRNALQGSLAGSWDIFVTRIAPCSPGVVTNIADSGVCTLRQAILDANSGACPSPCKITFQIPPPVPAGGFFTIQPLAALPFITAASTIIDGATQTAFSGNTNADGPEIVLDFSKQPIITGNYGLTIANASAVEIRNLCLHSASTAIAVIGTVSNCVIAGNYIGTDAKGTATAPNLIGIDIESGTDTRIGGNSPADRNVISGNALAGIYQYPVIGPFAKQTSIIGNFIGTDRSGTSAVPNGWGILLHQENATGSIGGGTPAERNVIAFNQSGGIALTGRGSRHRILRNSIYANGHLGIDLVKFPWIYGVTLNDIGDGDTGDANELQNYPLIQQATYAGAALNVTLGVDSSAVQGTKSIAIELFRADGSANPQGKVFLASQCLVGNFFPSVAISIPNAPVTIQSIVATATSYADNLCKQVGDATSEFSPAVAVTGALKPCKLNLTGKEAFCFEPTRWEHSLIPCLDFDVFGVKTCHSFCSVVSCPPCLVGLTCPAGTRFEILFRSPEGPLRARILDERGEEVGRSERLKTPIRAGGQTFDQVIRFAVRPGVQYYVDVQAPADTPADRVYPVEFRMRGRGEP